MSVTMKDVKAISIPQGTVRDIWDSGRRIWGSQADFPYRRLEYVYCNGTAACESGITVSTTANSNGVSVFKLKIRTDDDVTTQQRVIANYTSGVTLTRMYAVCVNGSTLQNVMGSNWGNGPNNLTTDTEYTIESSVVYNNRYIKVNGTNYALNTSTSYSAASGNQYGIGAGYNKTRTPVWENGFKGRIYDIEMISSNGNRHFYYIPVQRKSDGKVGFLKYSVFSGVDNYDDTFLPSGWTSEFQAGPVIDEYYNRRYDDDHYPYRKLEYIHFNGAEYIESNMSTTSTSTTIKFSIDDNSLTQCLTGTYNTSPPTGNTGRYEVCRLQSGNINVYYGYQNANPPSIATYIPNDTIRKIVTSIESSANNKKTMTVNIYDNSNQLLTSTSATDNGYPLRSGGTYIMARRYAANELMTGTADSFTKGKLYYLEMALRTFYPCQRKSDGVCGLYCVSGDSYGGFYPMVGTTITQAAAGPTVDEYWNLQ